MTIRELIHLLQQEPPDTEVHLMNGVGGYSSLQPLDLGWQEPIRRRFYPPRPEDGSVWKPEPSVAYQGPLKPVYAIVADW